MVFDRKLLESLLDLNISSCLLDTQYFIVVFLFWLVLTVLLGVAVILLLLLLSLLLSLLTSTMLLSTVMESLRANQTGSVMLAII